MRTKFKTWGTMKAATLLLGVLLAFSTLLINSCSSEDKNTEAVKQAVQDSTTEYTCAMHPQIRSNEPGTCPICGMELIPVEKKDSDKQASAEESTEYTCAMHPQIRSNEPGTCPICGMELIPVEKDSQQSEEEAHAHTLSPEALALANIVIDTVKKMPIQHTIYMLGKVEPDERLITWATARVPGRLEKLYVSFTGQEVRKGQVIGYIYSPELISAQQELLEAYLLKEQSPQLFEAAKQRLLLWSLTEAEIDSILKTGKVKYYFPVVSPVSGTVLEMKVEEGDYVKEGEIIFEVADLRRNIWVMLEAYEQDLPWLSVGQKVTLSVEGLGNKTWTGKITFIDPFVDRERRIARVRVELPNPNLELRPGMFVRGKVIVSTGKKKVLAVPRTAILWTGKRSLVWVKLPGDDFRFVLREVDLGARFGDYYIIKSGLREGEEIVTYGVFKVDASAQLMGMQSMMGGGGSVHQHGGHGGGSSSSETSPSASMKCGAM